MTNRVCMPLRLSTDFPSLALSPFSFFVNSFFFSADVHAFCRGHHPHLVYPPPNFSGFGFFFTFLSEFCFFLLA